MSLTIPGNPGNARLNGAVNRSGQATHQPPLKTQPSSESPNQLVVTHSTQCAQTPKPAVQQSSWNLFSGGNIYHLK